jgi:hypothetical protein
MVCKVVTDMTDDEYHQQLPLEEHSFSSSQVKSASKGDGKKFHTEVVLGEKATFGKVTLDAFTVGHYFHAHYLEPHKMPSFVEYKGKRAGNAWKDFEEANIDNTIMNPKMIEDGQTLIRGVEESAPSMAMLRVPFVSEISYFTELMGVPVKCRFDILHEDVKTKDGELISIGGDLKSTSEAVLDEDTLRKVIKNYGYALSYAMYRDVYEKVTGKKLDKWYWIFSSKKFPNGKLVWADEKYYELGRYQYRKGLEKIKELRADNWEYKDKAMLLAPSSFEMKYINENKVEELDL